MTTAPRRLRRRGARRRIGASNGVKDKEADPSSSFLIRRYGEVLSSPSPLPSPPCRSRCYTNVVVDVLGQVCVACLLPLFLIPVVNALPYLIDLIIVRILLSLSLSLVSVRSNQASPVVVRGSIDSAVAGDFRAFLSSLLPWWFCLGLVDSLEQETRAHRSYREE